MACATNLVLRKPSCLGQVTWLLFFESKYRQKIGGEMVKNVAKILIVVTIVLFNLNNKSLAITMEVNFNNETLGDFAYGTNITRQFFSKGIIFSDDPIGLQGNFTSLGWQENRVSTAEYLNNPFRIDFVYPEPVINVSATLHDGNLMYQIHNIFAFDLYGNIIDWDGFADITNGGYTIDPITLSVSSQIPIASVLFYEQNYGEDYGKNGGFGNEKISYLSYTTKAAPVPEPATIILLATGLLGLVGLGKKKLKR
jgi:hypothetical protein